MNALQVAAVGKARIILCYELLSASQLCSEHYGPRLNISADRKAIDRLEVLVA
jgi:hypothetical protein